MPRGRDDQERGATVLRELGEPRADERTQRIGQGKRLRGISALPARIDGPGQLEREERVPTRGFVETKERRPGEARPSCRCRIPWSAPALSEPTRRRAARAVGDRCSTSTSGSASPSRRARRMRMSSSVQSPEGKGESGGGGRIQPLDVVDRHQDRPTVGEQPQGRADAHGEGAEMTGSFASSRRSRATSSARRRAPGSSLMISPSASSSRSPSPACATPSSTSAGRDERTRSPRSRAASTPGEPECRFPDPRLALQNQRGHPPRLRAGRGRHGECGVHRPCPTCPWPRSFTAIVTPQGWKV